MKAARNSLLLATLALGTSHAFATSITIVAVSDNTLYQSDTGSLSNGSGSAMFAGVNSSFPATIRRCVFRFDIAGSVPSGSTITGALLSLSQNGNNADPQTCNLHRLTSSWGESTSIAGSGQGGGAPAAPNDATWLHRFSPGSFWATPGGDFIAAPSASTIVGGAGTFTWSSTKLIADIQYMLDNPAANYGWILRGNEDTTQSSKRFATHENTDAGTRPTLTIEIANSCPCDLNGDQLVDDSDFVLFVTAYNLLECADPTMPAGCPSDFNHDGIVDDSDFVLFVSAYNDLLCP